MLQIGNILDSYAATLTKRGDHDVFYMTTQGISQLVQRSVFLLMSTGCASKAIIIRQVPL